VWAQSADRLAQDMKSAKDDAALRAARDNLAKMGKEGASALAKVAGDTSAPPNVRVNAMLGLVKTAEDSGGAFGTAELAKYTQDSNPAVRYLALRGLISPATRYDKASGLLAEAIKDKAVSIREMAIKYIGERRDNPRLLAEMIVSPENDREVKGQAEKVFKDLKGMDFGYTVAMKRDPSNTKSTTPVPDPEKEKAAIAKYEGWLKEKENR
jgi:hypothetical protein